MKVPWISGTYDHVNGMFSIGREFYLFLIYQVLHHLLKFSIIFYSMSCPLSMVLAILVTYYSILLFSLSHFYFLGWSILAWINALYTSPISILTLLTWVLTNPVESFVNAFILGPKGLGKKVIGNIRTTRGIIIKADISSLH